MKKRYIALLAVAAIATGSYVSAQGREISGGLPWSNQKANVVLDARLAENFPDGTPVAVLNDILASERFSHVSDDRGSSTPTGDGRRFASRGVIRLLPGCSTRVSLRWEQIDGLIINMDGSMHQSCL